jgi:hypothetical protein
MKQSKNTIAIVIAIIAILVLGGAVYLVKQKGKNASKEETEAAVQVQSKIVTPEEQGAGKVGETKETLEGEEIVILPAELGGPPRVLPPAIFNESGQIKEVKEDSLVIAGTGYNFADQKPRDLTLKFSPNTVTNAQVGAKQIGFEGLTHLKVGDSITFESPENIRGKTEFDVTYVNKF